MQPAKASVFCRRKGNRWVALRSNLGTLESLRNSETQMPHGGYEIGAINVHQQVPSWPTVGLCVQMGDPRNGGLPVGFPLNQPVTGHQRPRTRFYSCCAELWAVLSTISSSLDFGGCAWRPMRMGFGTFGGEDPVASLGTSGPVDMGIDVLPKQRAQQSTSCLLSKVPASFVANGWRIRNRNWP